MKTIRYFDCEVKAKDLRIGNNIVGGIKVGSQNFELTYKVRYIDKFDGVVWLSLDYIENDFTLMEDAKVIIRQML